MDTPENGNSSETSPHNISSANEDSSVEAQEKHQSSINRQYKSVSGSDLDDEDVVQRVSNREALAARSSNREAENGDNDDDVDMSDDGGLFGSGSEISDGETNRRKRAASESNGSDDGSQNDEDAQSERERQIYEYEVGRHAMPRGSDGETYLLRMPNFMSIESTAFHNKSFQPPTTSHHSSIAAPQFSAYDTAMTTLRWRRSPNNPTELQSNARLLRWEDGSLTVQLASNPSEQFEIAAKSLAPPQPNPRKPTPTNNAKTPRTGNAASYDPQKDSFTYLAAPHEGAGILQVTNHLTTQLNVLPNKTVNDDAILKLQESLSAAVMKGDKKSTDGGIRFIEVTEDPELQQKRAELAEREKMKAQKRREAAEQRERNRATRVLNRSGIRSGGLSVGALEDDGMMLPTRKRAAPGSGKKRPSRRDRDDYDSDDDLPRGRTKEDEYDKTDGFVAGSDEELETDEGDDLEEEDAEGEPDVSEEEEREVPAREAPAKEPAADGARGKRRRVIIEEEEDDE